MKKPYRKMPEITLSKVKLRTITKHDDYDMYDYGKDPEVVKYLSWGPFTSLKDAKQSIKTIFMPRLKQGLPIGYAIVDLKSSKMIGTIDFHSRIKERHGAEIGYVLHKDFWNQGIMTEALKTLIELGFDYLGYDMIRIKHLKSNIASQKVIEKTRFRYVKTERFVFEKATGIVEDDMLIYELNKGE